MTTCADLIEDTLAHLYAGDRDERNLLNASITNSQTTLTVSYTAGGIVAGSVLEIDSELMDVWAVTTTTATVTRGQYGTTAAAHNAGAKVTVNPRFPRYRVFRALNDELADLSNPVNGLYQTKTVDLIFQAATQSYDLTGTGDINDILAVRYNETGPTKAWPAIRSYSLGTGLSTSQFASGNAITLYESGQPGRTIRVWYSAPFTPFANEASTIADAGLPDTAADIPPLGAAIRIMAGQEIRRNRVDAQPDSRRSSEVPAGAVLRSSAALQQLRLTRIAAEAARLQANPPEAYAYA